MVLCCVLKAGDGSRAGPEEEEAFKIENENRKRRDEREAIKLECPSSIHSSFCRVKRACLYNQPPSVEDNERQTLSLSLLSPPVCIYKSGDHSARPPDTTETPKPIVASPIHFFYFFFFPPCLSV